MDSHRTRGAVRAPRRSRRRSRAALRGLAIGMEHGPRRSHGQRQHHRRRRQLRRRLHLGLPVSDEDGAARSATSGTTSTPSVDTQGAPSTSPWRTAPTSSSSSRTSAATRPEYYRDKADLATADVVTVAGAAQTLPAWTIDAIPTVTGRVATTDGRAVRNATVQAYAADDSGSWRTAPRTASGAFRIGATEAVKLPVLRLRPRHRRVARHRVVQRQGRPRDRRPGHPGAGANVGIVTLAPGGSIAGRVTNEPGAAPPRAAACASGDCDYTNANGDYSIEGVDHRRHRGQFSDPIDEYAR